jgi:hypothetical protein
MTKKDFELLAQALRWAREDDLQYRDLSATDVAETHDLVATHVANALASTNPRFNRDRFIAAAGGRKA